MNILKRINARLSESSGWILNSPNSLVILMLMATSIAIIFFGLLAFVFGMGRNWLFMVLFGLFSLASLKKFWGIFKMVRKAGIKGALGGITANEIVWHKGGDTYGNSGHEDNEGSDEHDEDRSGKIGEEVRRIYRQSK